LRAIGPEQRKAAGDNCHHYQRPCGRARSIPAGTARTFIMLQSLIRLRRTLSIEWHKGDLGKGLTAAFAHSRFDIADLSAIGIGADLEVNRAAALRTKSRAGFVFTLAELANNYRHWVCVSNLIKPYKRTRISDRGGDSGRDPAHGYPQAFSQGMKWEANSQVRLAQVKTRRTSPDRGAPH
jgi:hypothetical protein